MLSKLATKSKSSCARFILFTPHSVLLIFIILSLRSPNQTSTLTDRNLNCALPERLGDHYGGWVICPPLKGARFQNNIVYSIGVGRNIKWDLAMISKYDTEHHAWDPTPTALDFVKKNKTPEGYHFHAVGLGAKDGNLTLKLPKGNHDSYTVMEYGEEAQNGTVVQVSVKTVETMMKGLNHTRLGVLKMDVEGVEFDVIRAWGKQGWKIPADLVLVEFHERYFQHERGWKGMVEEAVTTMGRLGFVLVVRTRLECTFANRESIAS